MCEWFDETCGQLIGYLETKGIRDNMLIVYVSDNGWIQNPTNKRFTARSKQSPYEGGVRQPIIFSWPGKLKAQDRKELATSLDIFPTILAATGVAPTEKETARHQPASLYEGANRNFAQGHLWRNFRP